MTEGNISQEFRSKNIDGKRNSFVEEIEQNELIKNKHKKVCAMLKYNKRFLILDSAVNGCILISAFTFLFGIAKGITSSAIGLKTYAITKAIKKYKSITKKKKKKHDKIVLLAKSKLNSIEVLISKALIDSSISHDELVLKNNVLKEYNGMKKRNKKPSKTQKKLKELELCIKIKYISIFFNITTEFTDFR